MKRTLLFSLCLAAISVAQAQKTTAYAITAVNKGGLSWTEVKLIDVVTGEEVQSVFQSTADVQLVNARTGKPISRREDGRLKAATDKPFATNSAACAYDKKHNRLYYTPMGIGQLRYIDLKAKTPTVAYFEEEDFGVIKSSRGAASQITRMVIASDGKGYALTNDANHLIQFATKKKQEITDLGALTDDAANGKISVHSTACFGGDMIADKDENLYLIGANRAVFKISLATRVATYAGSIKGLPRGYSTNGAVAEGTSKIVVSSSNSTQGYYRFDLNTLEAEKISGDKPVFNASDLANGILAFEKKDKKEEPKTIFIETIADKKSAVPEEAGVKSGISVYPNPITDGYFKLSFANALPGRYQIQFTDIAGKVISTQVANVGSKGQVEEFRLPQKPASGSYLVKVISEDGTYSETKKVIVQ